MFDIWLGDMELTTLVLGFSVLILLPVQLFLCFRAKRRIARLIPVLVLSVLTTLSVVMFFFTTGWDGIGYAVLAIFTGLMLLMCGIGWIIWALVTYIRKHRKK